MTVVALCLASGACFGAMTVALRLGLAGAGAAAGAMAMLVWAAGLAVAAAIPRHDLENSWKFFLMGLLAPGCSQALFTRSVREAGPSRTSVTVGAAWLTVCITFPELMLKLPSPLYAAVIVCPPGASKETLKLAVAPDKATGLP